MTVVSRNSQLGGNDCDEIVVNFVDLQIFLVWW